MERKRCIQCGENRRCRENRAALFFFIIGLIATIAIRVVTVLMHLNPLYGQIAWYIGVGGFLLFFIYKFRIDSSRHQVIIGNRLIPKILGNEELRKEDKETIRAILCALTSSKDRINYFVIFASSGLALVIGVYFDFLR